MKKWLLIGSLALVLIVVGVIVLGVSKIGPIIKSSVNTYGPGITKTDVRLGDVNIALLSGQAKLKDFYLGNPRGFKSPEAVKVGSILVDVDEGSLTAGTIIIDRIEVRNPQLTYEKTAGKDNFQTILNNITGATGKGKASSSRASGDQQSGNRKIIIRDFQLTGGKVNLSASMLGQSKKVSATLPDIHLTGIGETKGGVKPAEAFQIVFAELSKHINSPDVMNAFTDQLKQLNVDADVLKKIDPAEVKGVADTFKNILGK